jgi:hypothetical protein
LRNDRLAIGELVVLPENNRLLHPVHVLDKAIPIIGAWRVGVSKGGEFKLAKRPPGNIQCVYPYRLRCMKR